MLKVSPPLPGGSKKIHSIKCTKLLTSTVHRLMLLILRLGQTPAELVYYTVCIAGTVEKLQMHVVW